MKEECRCLWAGKQEERSREGLGRWRCFDVRWRRPGRGAVRCSGNEDVCVGVLCVVGGTTKSHASRGGCRAGTPSGHWSATQEDTYQRLLVPTGASRRVESSG